MAQRKKIIWSVKAKDDLLAIMEYYYIRNGNNLYSRKIYNKIRKDLDLLRTRSFLGRPTDIDNIRIIVVLDYFVFYEVLGNSIFVTNIWDTRRNPENFPQ